MRPQEHVPVFPRNHYSPGTREEPGEFTVYCSCDGWEFHSIESGTSGLDTDFWPDFNAHAQEEAYE